MRNDSICFERRHQPIEPIQRKQDDGEGGPSRPEVDRPDTRDLLRRMRRVDPNQARRYRQRTGE
ncbi:MAG: ubiquitin-like protein UBact [bacterium]|nr:ubiquitin-like protein UBact [bacterium]